MEVARSKNSTPLPTIKPHCGIRLPPDRYCLSACNYKLKVPKKTGTKSSISTSSTSSPRMSGVLGGRAVIRPNSPAVRVQTRPIVKVNTSGASGPKIQIAVPSLPTASINLPLPPQDSEGSKGIKREREEDDYDAPWNRTTFWNSLYLSQYIFYRIHVQELNYVIKWNYLN